MVVAVIAMGMVQMPVDEVIHVIAMGYRFVPTTGSVHVTSFVTAAFVFGGARVCVGVADFDDMLFNGAIGVLMVQVTVVQVVSMTIVIHGGMTTLLTVLVLVIGMRTHIGNSWLGTLCFPKR